MRDEGISEALRRYIERAAGPFAQDIHLSFEGGVALLAGRVATTTHARAITDLVGAQDAVFVVIDRLQVPATSPTSSSTT